MGPVAKGEVELGIITIPFIMAEPNAELVGPLPDELQEYVVYAAALSATTKAEGAARELISHITAPIAAPAYRADGLDPLGK